ncbi:MAG: formylglycine-generating enzyme family protein, partial [Pseudomonadota bacterium]
LCELGGGRDENIWFCGNAGGATQPVTLKLPNPWGLHDMHGNVFEWCLGWMGDYPVGPVTDPVGPETGTGRVRRGGSWNSAARDTRSASRNSGSPDMRNIATGFRVAAARPATLNISSNQEDIHQSSSQRLTFTLNGFEDFDGSGITIRGADLVDFRPFDPDNPFFWIMDLNNIGGPVTVTVPADAAVPFPPATTSTVASFSNFYQDTWTLQLRELNGEPVTMDMIRIPPGSFMMGAPNNEQGSFSQERPQFEATVEDAFYMSKTEVTQDQIVSIRSIQAIPPFPAAQTFIGGSLPVHNLTKSDGDFATDRLFEHLVVSGQIFIPGPGVPTVSLPTEIQWEYAARAGTTTRFSFGDGFASNDLCTLGGGREDHMWFCGNAAGSAQVVGQKLPNPWGVYDMHGNVSEWTATNFNIYPLPGVNPPLKDFSVRGGSWFRQARETRSAWRTPRDPGTRSSTIGFRVVINPDIRN